jgi:putative ABC transport system substrate-binding protein
MKRGKRREARGKKKNMKKRITLWLLANLFLANVSLADAQQTGKIFRIGFLDVSTASGSAVLIDAFRQEMRKLGWIEGKNITIELRFADQKFERVPNLADELVRLKVDAIVTGGSGSTRAAKEATVTVPIVMAQDPDPVGNGFVASLARPGGNVTGLSGLSIELNTKRLEILKDAIPKLARVGHLRDPRGSITADLQMQELRAAAQALKLKLEEITTQVDAKGFESAFQTAKQKQVGAIMTSPLAPFSPPESGSSSLPANTACRLFTFRRSLSMRAVSCSTGRTTLTFTDARLFTWTRS